MGWVELLDILKDQRLQLDKQVETVLVTQAEEVNIFCAKGCSNCCSLSVNCSFPEAVSIAKDLTPEQHQKLIEKLPLLRQISQQAENLKQFLRQFRKQIGGCPFLHPEDGSCGIYPRRPFSCRALLSTRNSSWCAVDFADLHPLEKEAYLSSLDPEVVAFPTHYLATSQELGLELEARAMVAMRDEFGISLSGNLIYQVWLEREHQLSEMIPEGLNTTRSFLQSKQLVLPFLLQLQGT